jgi:energy-coupling factor transport system substrate-specific component
MSSEKGHYAEIKEIITIALLSSLGGTLSTFVGYLGNLVNLALGVPFGAGQFIAGLHVFWLVLIQAIIRKRGAGTFGGLLKGIVELFTGSTHGIVIVLVSLVQGVLVDGFAAFGGDLQDADLSRKLVWWIGAGASAASNVIVFQLFYFSGAPIIYIGVITILAFCSGIIFGGYFGWETLDFLNDAGVLNNKKQAHNRDVPGKSHGTIVKRNIPAIAFVAFLILGTSYYVTEVANFGSDPYSCEVTGLVENPYVFHYSTFPEDMVTIEAELEGAYTYSPPTNYTGYLVSSIIDHASPQPEATTLKVIATDGYTIIFDLREVMNDDRFILNKSESGLWLIAAEYDGSQWVQQVTTFEIG